MDRVLASEAVDHGSTPCGTTNNARLCKLAKQLVSKAGDYLGSTPRPRTNNGSVAEWRWQLTLNQSDESPAWVRSPPDPPIRFASSVVKCLSRNQEPEVRFLREAPEETMTVAHRITAGRQDDLTATKTMIEAGSKALRLAAGISPDDAARLVYEAMIAARPKYSETDIKRFWQKVRVCGADDCWVWTGATKARSKANGWSAAKYGKMLHRGRQVSAHIISYEIANGPIGRGLFVCHSCDNPPCCNPKHLWAGTQQENNRDMWSKKRARPNGLNARGSRNSQSILTEDDIPAIRSLIENGLSQTAVAKKYGVTVQAINRIHRGVAWVHT